MPTTEVVTDVVVKIMVELLETFAIMTKEIKLGRASELVPDTSYMFPVVDRDSERSRKNFFKKLIRREGFEDVLSRLDRLTQQAVEITKTASTEEEKRQ